MHIDDIRHALNPNTTLRHLAPLVEAFTSLNRTKNEIDALIAYLQARGFDYGDALDITVGIIAGVLYRNYTTAKDLPDPDHLERLHTDLAAASAAYRI